MRVRHWITFCAALALLVLVGTSGVSTAAEVWGRASTVVEWYDTAREETTIPLYQYFLFGVSDIDGNGLSFRGYGRLADDLSDQNVDYDHRLYYAYLEKNDISGRLDVKLGRQFLATSAGAVIMDGLSLKLKQIGPVTFGLFGGGDVTYYEGYDTSDQVFGGEVTARLKDLLLGASYIQKREASDLTYELIGLDINYDLLNALDMYAETQINQLSNSISYFLGGFRYYRNPRWSLKTEYLYSLPIFSSTSIYSVFAVSEYQQILAELTFKFTYGVIAFARYTMEIYKEFANATVTEIGIDIVRSKKVGGYFSFLMREDNDGQELRGIKGRLTYLIGNSVLLGGGLHLDVLERRLEEEEGEDYTTSQRAWTDVTFYINKNVSLQAKFEVIQSELWDYYYRGQARLNIRF